MGKRERMAKVPKMRKPKPEKKAFALERSVKNALRAYLNGLGAYQYWVVPCGYGKTTIDVLVCHKGRFYGIECKREGVGKPSERQACIMREIAAAGGGVWVENSLGLEETRRRLGL